MAAKFAWILNLDADLELAAIASGAAGARTAYSPKRSVVEAMRTYAPKLASTLLDPENDLVIDEGAPPGSARGLIGRAFCPTPRALRILERAGAEPEAHPECDVLLRVNSRAFCSALGTTLPAAHFVTTEESARAVLETAPPADLAKVWRVKRNFGMTGRGQRLVDPHAVSESDLAFVRAGLTEGGLQIEANVLVVDEFAIHGFLQQDGALALGPVVKQICDARGAWISSTPIALDDHDLQVMLTVELRRVASALTAARYFGPFGVDAYTYRVGAADDLGRVTIALQIRSEINARYTMGFAAKRAP